jgi:hypothetical protein
MVGRLYPSMQNMDCTMLCNLIDNNEPTDILSAITPIVERTIINNKDQIMRFYINKKEAFGGLTVDWPDRVVNHYAWIKNVRKIFFHNHFDPKNGPLGYLKFDMPIKTVTGRILQVASFCDNFNIEKIVFTLTFFVRVMALMNRDNDGKGFQLILDRLNEEASFNTEFRRMMDDRVNTILKKKKNFDKLKAQRVVVVQQQVQETSEAVDIEGFKKIRLPINKNDNMVQIINKKIEKLNKKKMIKNRIIATIVGSCNQVVSNVGELNSEQNRPPNVEGGPVEYDNLVTEVRDENIEGILKCSTNMSKSREKENNNIKKLEEYFNQYRQSISDRKEVSHQIYKRDKNNKVDLDDLDIEIKKCKNYDINTEFNEEKGLNKLSLDELDAEINKCQKYDMEDIEKLGDLIFNEKDTTENWKYQLKRGTEKMPINLTREEKELLNEGFVISEVVRRSRSSNKRRNNKAQESLDNSQLNIEPKDRIEKYLEVDVEPPDDTGPIFYSMEPNFKEVRDRYIIEEDGHGLNEKGLLVPILKKDDLDSYQITRTKETVGVIDVF